MRLLSVLVGVMCALGVNAQNVIAFQGGENTANDNWAYTDTGANSEALNQALDAANKRSGVRALVAGGLNSAAGSCFAGGTGNSPPVNNQFTFEEIDLSNYVGTPKTLTFWYGNRIPNCNGPGWDNGENLLFQPVLDGIPQAAIEVVSGGGDISLPITENSFEYQVPECVLSFGFVLRISLNRRDEVLLLDDVSLIVEGTASPVELAAGEGGTVCPGQGFLLQGEIIGYLDNVQWNGGSGTFSQANSPTTTYVASADESGAITLTLSAEDICGNVLSDELTLLVEGELPDPSIVSSLGVEMCSGQVATLTAFGGQDYLWSTGDIGEDIFIDSPGTYTVEVSNACGVATASITLQEAELLEVFATQHLCEGETVLLPNGIEVTDPGTYEVLVSGESACDTLYTVEVLPVIPLAVSQPEVNCLYDQDAYVLQFSISGGEGGNYVISGLEGTITGGIFQSDPIPVGQAYTLSISDSFGCESIDLNGMELCDCPATATLNAEVTLCEGDEASVELYVEGAFPITIQYTLSGENGVFVAENATSYLVISPTASTTLNLLSASTDYCTGSAFGTAQIEVQPIPDAGESTEVELCRDADPVELTDLLEGSPEPNGTWSYNGAPLGSAMLLPLISEGGTYTYTVESDICGSQSSDLWVELSEAPQLSLSGNVKLCPGQEATLHFDGMDQGEVDVVLSWGNASIAFPSLSFPYSVQVTQPGTYELYSVSAGLCEGVGTGGIEVLLFDEPSAQFEVVSEGETATMTALQSGSAQMGNLYHWQLYALDRLGRINRNLGSFPGTTAILEPEMSSPGGFRACLEVVSVDGCASVLCQDFDIDVARNFFMPSAFSPNADGLNDLLRPTLRGYENYRYHIDIFDRTGSIVFSTDDPHAGWDGSKQGGAHYLPAGIYVWRAILLERSGPGTVQFRGHCTLIR